MCGTHLRIAVHIRVVHTISGHASRRVTRHVPAVTMRAQTVASRSCRVINNSRGRDGGLVGSEASCCHGLMKRRR